MVGGRSGVGVCSRVHGVQRLFGERYGGPFPRIDHGLARLSPGVCMIGMPALSRPITDCRGP